MVMRVYLASPVFSRAGVLSALCARFWARYPAHNKLLSDSPASLHFFRVSTSHGRAIAARMASAASGMPCTSASLSPDHVDAPI